jgi:AraC-like DNA-binding protein
MQHSMMKEFSFLKQNIVFKYMNDKHTFNKHIHHDSYMIGTPLLGHSQFIIENKTYEVKPYDLCLIPPSLVHECHPHTQQWKFVTLHPSSEILQEIANVLCSQNTRFSFNDFFIKDEFLSKELKTIILKTLESELLEEQKVLDFLSLLLEKHAVFNQKTQEEKEEKFEPLFEYLKQEEYCLKHLDFYKMAKVMQMNPHYFHRIFSKTIGITPQNFINALRLRKAKELLENCSSLSQVALESGFYDQAYFTKQFKKHYGITPTKYKKLS